MKMALLSLYNGPLYDTVPPLNLRIFQYSQVFGKTYSKSDCKSKMAGPTRNVWMIVLQNFIKSLKPRQLRGNHMGKDYIGNNYYEIPPDASMGKRKATRWYNPAGGKDNFDNEIPAEWDSWLRMRRSAPPTEEEIAQNLAIANMKKINAAKIEEKRLAEGGSLPAPPPRGSQSFPKYPDMLPGDPEGHYLNPPNKSSTEKTETNANLGKKV